MNSRKLRDELIRYLASARKFPDDTFINNEALQLVLEKMIALCDIVRDIEQEEDNKGDKSSAEAGLV
jgi:hypothetical protein